jgi:2-keto-myo-inositol isomerase
LAFNEATTLKNSTLRQDLSILERSGFDYIEIWLCQLKEYLKTSTINDLKHFFRNSNIKPYAIDSFEDILFNDIVGYARLKNEVKQACEWSAAIGCDRMVVVPTIRQGINRQYTPSQIKEESIEVLSALSEITHPYNIKIGFEPIGFEECAVRSISSAWDIVQEVDRDNVGLTLDTFNNYLFNAFRDLNDLFSADCDKIFIFHINDALVKPLNEYRLDHRDRLLPGDGELPLSEYLYVLREIGFTDTMSLELFNPELYSKSPEEVISSAYKKLSAIICQPD